MTVFLENQSLLLRIERVNYLGQGVAYLSDKKYLVPYVMTGELVKANVLESKKNFVLCELQSVIEPSPLRVQPLCEVYDRCGGCQLQHMSYAEQLRLKMEWLKTLLAAFPEVKMRNPIPSPKEYFYRNRVNLHHDKKTFGYYQKQTHQIVAIQKCVIASETVNQKINASVLKQPSPVEIREDAGVSFLQVNTGQNENLIKTVLDYVGKKKSQKVLELYCGSGNLSFPLSEICQKVIAVEGDVKACTLAEQKRIAQKNKKISFTCGDVQDVLFKLREDYQNYDVIVCDPPRTGLGDAVTFLDKFSAQKIIYVSCDSQSFIKDTKIITQKHYSLQEITPLDMFPQTVHLEIVGLFVKN